MYNQRLKTEAQILKEMNHPNLVSFRHQYNDGSLALEAAECSLSDLIDKLTETNITIESVLFPACDISNMIKDCNNGLLYLHESVAIMHGDLKPGNILIKNGVYKLCDFGTSLKLDENLICMNPDEYVGTAPYLPPELKDDGLDTTYSTSRSPLSNKTDIWQLGLVIFEMMTLSTPHFQTVETELAELELDSEEEDWEECWDDIFRRLAGTRPRLPHWIHNELENHTELKPMFDIFLATTAEYPEDRPTAIIICSFFQ